MRKMLSKIFLSVLLLTYVYTYTSKSIKDNNYTNYRKLSNNFNFESNGIQTVEPNLKTTDNSLIRASLRLIFGHSLK